MSGLFSFLAGIIDAAQNKHAQSKVENFFSQDISRREFYRNELNCRGNSSNVEKGGWQDEALAVKSQAQKISCRQKKEESFYVVDEQHARGVQAAVA